MSDVNANNLIEQLSEMLKNDNIPDDIKNIFNSLNNSSNNSNKNENNSNDSSLDIDMDTLLKMKQLLSSMNSNKDDPRTNLLISFILIIEKQMYKYPVLSTELRRVLQQLGIISYIRKDDL